MKGFSGAVYKKFNTLQEAETFITSKNGGPTQIATNSYSRQVCARFRFVANNFEHLVNFVVCRLVGVHYYRAEQVQSGKHRIQDDRGKRQKGQS